MKEQDMNHLGYIDGILRNDSKVIFEKEAMYLGSWKARGGIGAFFVSSRKWDALENMLQKPDMNYDIFRAIIEGGPGDGRPLEQVRDLRRYLTLIEAECIRLTAPKPSAPRDQKQGQYGTGEDDKSDRNRILIDETVAALNTEQVNDRPNS